MAPTHELNSSHRLPRLPQQMKSACPVELTAVTGKVSPGIQGIGKPANPDPVAWLTIKSGMLAGRTYYGSRSREP